jgi:N4-(beta-N-acetylglucosaminyl)-L-asparaginase
MAHAFAVGWLLALLVAVECTGPIVITTFSNPDHIASSQLTFQVLSSGGSRQDKRLDALVEGLSLCEARQCDGSVGFGGAPDETGETTLDASITDGENIEIGAVSGLRFIKNAIGVARAVLDYTTHTMLVGQAATNFAIEMGFTNESLSTNSSIQWWQNWVAAKCQPNYRRNVVPSPSENCGPYTPVPRDQIKPRKETDTTINQNNHDTIASVVVDATGRVAAGTTTNGKGWKVPGRVGDSPLMGSGNYADSRAGGCGATGDGDIMMRFVPCYQTVENMKRGMSPLDAARDAIARILEVHPTFSGAVIALGKDGSHGGASGNWALTYTTVSNSGTVVVPIHPMTPQEVEAIGRNRYARATKTASDFHLLTQVGLLPLVGGVIAIVSGCLVYLFTRKTASLDRSLSAPLV